MKTTAIIYAITPILIVVVGALTSIKLLNTVVNSDVDIKTSIDIKQGKMEIEKRSTSNTAQEPSSTPLQEHEDL